MTRPSLLLLAGLVVGLGMAAPAPAAGQSSQFGSRGLGFPTRPYSARSLGLGGGFALFDTESSLNPSALGSLRLLEATATATNHWRNTRNAFGEAYGRDTRFPLIHVGGPISTSETGRVRLAASASLTAYSDRNFAVASVDTILLRDELREVRDTLSSQGGLSDLRIATAWNLGTKVTLGAAAHLITGLATIRSAKVVEGEEYGVVAEISEISYLSYGASFGVTLRPSPSVTLAGVARLDAPARVERDTTRVGDIDLPVLLGAGARITMHPRLQFAGQVLHRGWGSADAAIRAQGGVGARNTLDAAGGFEWASSSRDVTRWPLRFGGHYATLPFPLESGGKGKEVGVSVGTGLRLGLGGRGSLDMALARVWRSEGIPWREQAWLLTVGITVRPPAL